MAQRFKSGLDRLIVEVSTPHTMRHTQTPGGTPLNEWSAGRRGRYLHNTRQTIETDIHAISEIHTRDFKNRAAADLRHKPHGHLDHQSEELISSTYISVLTELNANGGSNILWYTVSFFLSFLACTLYAY